MKKLYRKGTVHPSPSPSPSPSSSSSSSSLTLDQFFLPATIITLAATLSAADKEVLSYLLSADKEPHNRKKPSNYHSPCFTCYCFTCYTTYWARWDSSPNRQLIHEIIDAFEEGLLANKNKKKQNLSRRDKRKNNVKNSNSKGLVLGLEAIDELDRVSTELGRVESEGELGEGHGNGEDETGEKQGTVRKIVGFIGERIWGSVWG